MNGPDRGVREVVAALSRGRGPLVAGCLLLLGGLALSHGLLFGQSQDKGLFIDSQGKIGIGNATPQAALDVTGAVKADSFEGVGAVPKGAILMWWGQSDQVPKGWALCDGKDKRTPDLRDRFVLGAGAGGKRAPGDSGGAEEYTLSIAQMPPHDHTGFTGKDGKHYHGIDPKQGDSSWGKRSANPKGLKPYAFAADPKFAGEAGAVTGGSDDHSHTIPKEGGGQAYKVMPPFYALAFIMKVD